MIRIIGMGQENQGDDGIGLAVAQQIANRGIKGVEVFGESGDGSALMELWQDCTAVIVIDAIPRAQNPGRIVRLEVGKDPLTTRMFRCGGKTFGITEAVELSRSMNSLPHRLILIGMEGARFQPGNPITPTIAAELGKLEGAVLTEVAKLA
jgi:hydrogenase maturation protease